MGAKPIEKNATNDITVVIANPTIHVSFFYEWSMIMKENLSVVSETIMPPTLLKSNGRRPILSRKKVATKIEIVFTNLTAIVASSICLLEEMDSDIDDEDVTDDRCGTDEELLPYAFTVVALTLHGDDIVVALRRNSGSFLDVGEFEKSCFLGVGCFVKDIFGVAESALHDQPPRQFQHEHNDEVEEHEWDGSDSEHHPPPQAKCQLRYCKV
ncbi:hypothetical protein QYF36_016951 [Acer negundo]|nr:hypothetical protein QYF36_016951 [Acer negundo]